MAVDRIGFIGLGVMGRAMALRLLREGHALRVYNRTPERSHELGHEGATPASQPAATAAHGGVVVTMVSDDHALKEVTLGTEGLLGRLGEGGVHLSMSTVSPQLSRELSELHAGAGEHYVAAPVFGRPPAAEAGQLWICFSGSATARQRVRPLLALLGRELFEFGDDPGAANVVKLAGNFLIITATEAMAEAFSLAEKNGIERRAVHDFVSSTLFACPIYRNYGLAVAEHRYEPPGFGLPLGLKDIWLALQTAHRSGVPMPLAGVVHDRLLASVSKGRSHLDVAGLAVEASEAAGL
jgi:3-hydroxyisobutyrate dehydrogenase-like beta-hydroxyacid dehydrogenase